MPDQRFQRVTDLFSRACALPPDQRQAFLDQACPRRADADTRSEIDRMLAADARADGLISAAGGGATLLARAIAEEDEAPSASRSSITPTSAGDSNGSRPALLSGPAAPGSLTATGSSGTYRLLELIGEGGMGQVYKAEQANPRRTVAVKLIRAGSASRSAARRFAQEAAALARLQHPGIAQIYEAGTDQSGQAFIAMEYVRGLPLVEAARSFDLPAKLALVADVCDAVAHAHQRGVIHRDLKPANILVDEHRQPKVLDFGVARVGDEPGSSVSGSTTMHTLAGQIIGTLAYMSPEQARGLHDQVDARSDVYALGVMLFEILTGQTPLPLKDKSLAEAGRIIAEEEPTRLADIDRAFRGDLDVIAARAMAKDPARRYQSADALADDLRRTLAGDPIQARQDSAVYIMRRRLRRYQTLAALVAIAVISIVAFAVNAYLQVRRESAARRQIETLYQSATVERERADANAESFRRQLRTSTIEQARLMAASGGMANAEPVLWREHLAEPSDFTAWSLRELYARMPCILSVASETDAGQGISASADSTRVITTAADRVYVWDTCDWSLVNSFPTHHGPILASLIAPDGQSAVFSNNDGTLSRLGLPDGEFISSVAIERRFWNIAIASGPDSPGLRAVAAACTDGSVRLIDFLTDPPVMRVLGIEPNELQRVAISPSGRLVLAAGETGTVGLWRTDTGERIAGLPNHADGIAALSFAPDGTSLYTGGRDRVVRRYSLDSTDTPRFMASHEGTNGTVRAVRFEPDGKHIVIPGYYRLDRLDALTLREAPERSTVLTTAYDVVFGPDNSWVAAATNNYVVRVWEPRPHPDNTVVRAHINRVSSLAINPEGTLLASASDEGIIHLWNVPALTPAGDITGHPGRIRALAFSPDGQFLASGGLDPKLRIWRVADRSLVRTIPNIESEIHDCSFSPDGTLIAATPRYSGVKVWSVQTGQEAGPPIEALKEMASAKFTPDGLLLYTSLRRVFLRDVLTGTTRVSLPTPYTPWQCCVLPSEGLGAFSTWAGPTVLFDLKTGDVRHTLTGHTQLVNRVFPVRLLDGGRTAPTLPAGSVKPASATPTPPKTDDSALRDALATVAGDGVLKLWDPRSGLCLATLNPDQGGINCAVAVTGRQQIITGHTSGTMVLWDLRHYDRHIEGNRDAMIKRLESDEFARPTSLAPATVTPATVSPATPRSGPGAS